MPNDDRTELISTGTAGIPLRDQDATNMKDGEWTKVNTLGHYKLDEMVRIITTLCVLCHAPYICHAPSSLKPTLIIPRILFQSSGSAVAPSDQSAA